MLDNNKLISKIKENQTIVNEFIKLIDQIKFDMDHSSTKQEQIKHSFRLKQINNVLKILINFTKPIKSIDDVKNIEGIGKGSIDRIKEILDTGYLSEISSKNDKQQYVKYTDELQQIIGIGPRKAFELVNDYNITSIEQLKQEYKKGNIELTNEILLGLKYHNIYQQNIPRAEIDLINIFLNNIVKQVDQSLQHIICGSYRREKPFSNDIDVLLTSTKIQTKEKLESSINYLRILVDKLKSIDFLVDDLTDKDYVVKYMGFCKYQNFPIRRIDIRYVPYESYYSSLLYFTGSGDFNSKMRSVAKELGFLLNEYGLFIYKNNKPVKIKINSEKDIFDNIGMEYIVPKLR